MDIHTDDNHSLPKYQTIVRDASDLLLIDPDLYEEALVLAEKKKLPLRATTIEERIKIDNGEDNEPYTFQDVMDTELETDEEPRSVFDDIDDQIGVMTLRIESTKFSRTPKPQSEITEEEDDHMSNKKPYTSSLDTIFSTNNVQNVPGMFRNYGVLDEGEENPHNLFSINKEDPSDDDDGENLITDLAHQNIDNFKEALFGVNDNNMSYDDDDGRHDDLSDEEFEELRANYSKRTAIMERDGNKPEFVKFNNNGSIVNNYDGGIFDFYDDGDDEAMEINKNTVFNNSVPNFGNSFSWIKNPTELKTEEVKKVELVIKPQEGLVLEGQDKYTGYTTKLNKLDIYLKGNFVTPEILRTNLTQLTNEPNIENRIPRYWDGEDYSFIAGERTEIENDDDSEFWANADKELGFTDHGISINTIDFNTRSFEEIEKTHLNELTKRILFLLGVENVVRDRKNDLELDLPFFLYGVGNQRNYTFDLFENRLILNYILAKETQKMIKHYRDECVRSEEDIDSFLCNELFDITVDVINNCLAYRIFSDPTLTKCEMFKIKNPSESEIIDRGVFITKYFNSDAKQQADYVSTLNIIDYFCILYDSDIINTGNKEYDLKEKSIWVKKEVKDSLLKLEVGDKNRKTFVNHINNMLDVINFENEISISDDKFEAIRERRLELMTDDEENCENSFENEEEQVDDQNDQYLDEDNPITEPEEKEEDMITIDSDQYSVHDNSEETTDENKEIEFHKVDDFDDILDDEIEEKINDRVITEVTRVTEDVIKRSNKLMYNRLEEVTAKFDEAVKAFKGSLEETNSKVDVLVEEAIRESNFSKEELKSISSSIMKLEKTQKEDKAKVTSILEGLSKSNSILIEKTNNMSTDFKNIENKFRLLEETPSKSANTDEIVGKLTDIVNTKIEKIVNDDICPNLEEFVKEETEAACIRTVNESLKLLVDERVDKLITRELVKQVTAATVGKVEADIGNKIVGLITDRMKELSGSIDEKIKELNYVKDEVSIFRKDIAELHKEVVKERILITKIYKELQEERSATPVVNATAINTVSHPVSDIVIKEEQKAKPVVDGVTLGKYATYYPRGSSKRVMIYDKIRDLKIASLISTMTDEQYYEFSLYGFTTENNVSDRDERYNRYEFSNADAELEANIAKKHNKPYVKVKAPSFDPEREEEIKQHTYKKVYGDNSQSSTESGIRIINASSPNDLMVGLDLGEGYNDVEFKYNFVGGLPGDKDEVGVPSQKPTKHITNIEAVRDRGSRYNKLYNELFNDDREEEEYIPESSNSSTVVESYVESKPKEKIVNVENNELAIINRLKIELQEPYTVLKNFVNTVYSVGPIWHTSYRQEPSSIKSYNYNIIVPFMKDNTYADLYVRYEEKGGMCVIDRLTNTLVNPQNCYFVTDYKGKKLTFYYVNDIELEIKIDGMLCIDNLIILDLQDCFGTKICPSIIKHNVISNGDYCHVHTINKGRYYLLNKHGAAYGISNDYMRLFLVFRPHYEDRFIRMVGYDATISASNDAGKYFDVEAGSLLTDQYFSFNEDAYGPTGLIKINGFANERNLFNEYNLNNAAEYTFNAGKLAVASIHNFIKDAGLNKTYPNIYCLDFSSIAQFKNYDEVLSIGYKNAMKQNFKIVDISSNTVVHENIQHVKQPLPEVKPVVYVAPSISQEIIVEETDDFITVEKLVDGIKQTEIRRKVNPINGLNVVSFSASELMSSGNKEKVTETRKPEVKSVKATSNAESDVYYGELFSLLWGKKEVSSNYCTSVIGALSDVTPLETNKTTGVKKYNVAACFPLADKTFSKLNKGMNNFNDFRELCSSITNDFAENDELKNNEELVRLLNGVTTILHSFEIDSITTGIVGNFDILKKDQELNVTRKNVYNGLNGTKETKESLLALFVKKGENFLPIDESLISRGMSEQDFDYIYNRNILVKQCYSILDNGKTAEELGIYDNGIIDKSIADSLSDGYLFTKGKVNTCHVIYTLRDGVKRSYRLR